MRNDYIRTARAEGLRERAVVVKHALKKRHASRRHGDGNSGGQPAFRRSHHGNDIRDSRCGPAGSGCNWKPGYAAASGHSAFTTVLIILGNLVADLLYSVLDPKIRVE